jgi:hypothetical protein
MSIFHKHGWREQGDNKHAWRGQGDIGEGWHFLECLRFIKKECEHS